MQIAVRLVSVIVLCLLAYSPICAQSSKKKAEKFYKEKQYQKAYDEYVQIKNIQKDKVSLAKKGISSYYINKLSEASKDITAAYKMGNTAPDLKYYMGRINHSMRKYEDAIFFYKSYLRDLKASEEIKPEVAMYIKNCFAGLRLSYEEEDLGLVENAGSGVNSKDDEINPVPSPTYVNRYYYSSNRAQDNFDLFSAEMMEGKWLHGDHIHSSLNTANNEILQDCSLDGSVMVFLRGDKYGSNRLYLNRYSQSKHNQRVIFSETKAVTGDQDVYLVNDEIMIFASNREGGYGGYDLYISEFSSAGWSKPINLGPEVNSSYDERYPFLVEDQSQLFFSSNNPNSIGGFDIFSCNKSGDDWSELMSYAYPINSPEDDIQFRIQEEGFQAYFSSNRKSSSFGGYDIYTVFLRQAVTVHSSDPKQPLGLIRSSVKDEDYAYEEEDKEKREEEKREARLEQERLEQERFEQEKLEQEKLEQEKLEQERLEQERLEQEKLEQERLENERREKEKRETRLEEERKEKEKLELEKKEQERLEQERLEQERLEEERLQEERLEQEKLEKERLEKERREKEKREARLEQEKLEQERLEKERLEQEKKEQERLEQERLEKEKLEKEKLEKEEVTKDPVVTQVVDKEEDLVQVEKQEEELEDLKPKEERKKKRNKGGEEETKDITSISLSPIIYKTESELLNEENKEILDRVIEKLKNSGQSKIILTSHTLPEGLPEFELMFAIKRAEKISDYITENGVDPSRIILNGVGSAYPFVKKLVDPEMDKENRIFNNRVDIKLVNISGNSIVAQPSIDEKLLSPKYQIFQTVTEDVYFRVFVHQTEKKMYKNAILRYYNDLLIENDLNAGLYKYYVGLYTDFKSAFELKRELENRNVSEASIVAYYNGNMLSIADAKLLKSQYPELVNFIEINQ